MYSNIKPISGASTNVSPNGRYGTALNAKAHNGLFHRQISSTMAISTAAPLIPIYVRKITASDTFRWKHMIRNANVRYPITGESANARIVSVRKTGAASALIL